MGQDIAKIQLIGPASVSVGGVNVGHTDETGVKLALANTIVEALAGKYGQSPTKAWMNGQRAEIEFMLTQTELSTLVNALPGGTYTIDTTKEKIQFGKIAGTPLTGVQLIFTPENAAETPDFDLTVPVAVPIGDFELIYSAEGNQKWACKFLVLINEGGGSNGNYLFTFGDASATADTTRPTAGSPTPSDGATGVSVSTTVQVTVDEELDANTVDPYSVFLVKDPMAAGAGTKVAGTVVLVNNGASTTITFTPSSNLTAATDYLFTCTDAIKDKNGNRLNWFDTDFQTA